MDNSGMHLDPHFPPAAPTNTPDPDEEVIMITCRMWNHLVNRMSSVCLWAGKSRSPIDPDPNFRASIEFGQWLWTAPDRVERVTAYRFEWIGQFDRSTDRSSGWSGQPPPEARNWFDRFERARCRTSGRSVSICCESRTVSGMHLIRCSNFICPDTPHSDFLACCQGNPSFLYRA